MSEGFVPYVNMAVGHGMEVDTFSQNVGIDTLDLSNSTPPVQTNETDNADSPLPDNTLDKPLQD